MKNLAFGLILGTAIVFVPSAAIASTILGQVAVNEAYIDGVSAATGTTVTSPSQIHTRDEHAIIHFTAGARLYLGPNSAAQLSTGPTGYVEISADTGTVQLADTRGEVMTLAYHSMAIIDQQGDAELYPDQRVCVLGSPGNNTADDCSADHTLKGCEWHERIAMELETGNVYFVPEGDDDCNKDKGVAAWVWWAGGGAAAAALAIELTDDDSDDTGGPGSGDGSSPFGP